MGIRIQYEFTSNHDGVEYKCEIHDVDWAAPTNDASGNGFVVTYNGADGKPLSNIFGSSCDLQLAWRETDTFMQAFINDLKGANEYEFALVIYRDAELYWVGNITSDSLMWDNDNHTRYVTINAIDGLGRLRDMTYDNIVPGILEEWTEVKQVYEVILDLLSLNNLDQFWDASDPYIVAQPHWILNTSFSDWIDRLSVPRFLFLKDDTEVNKTNREPLSAYECLEVILSHLNMRIVHSDGRYYLQQVMGMTGATAAYQYVYYKANMPVSSSPWKWWVSETTNVTRNRTIGTDITALSGGKFRYMPALRRAEVKLPDRQLAVLNLQSDYTLRQLNPTNCPFTETSSLGVMRGGAGKKMRILLDITQLFIQTGTTLSYRSLKNRYFLQLRIKIIAGSYRLFDNGKTDGTLLTWTTTDTSHSVYINQSSDGFVYNEGAYISLVTPDIPWTTETVTMEVTYDIIDRNTGASYVLSPVWYVMDIKNVAVTFLNDNQILTQSKLRINNPDITDYENNTTYEHPEYMLDDIGLVSNQNSFQLNTTTTTYANVTAVDSGHSTDQVISATLIMDAMALQMNPVQIYEGPITGEYNPHETMTYDSEVYVFNGGKFDAAADLWDAQWWQSSPELGTVTNPDRDTGKGYVYDGDDFPKPYVRFPPPWDHSGDVKDAFYRERIGSGGGAFGETITSLPLTSASESLLKSGDNVIILNADTMEQLATVVLTADVDSADTTMTFTSVTLENNIPPTASVMLKGSDGFATPMLRTNELQLSPPATVTIATGDTFLIFDSSDGNKIKKVAQPVVPFEAEGYISFTASLISVLTEGVFYDVKATSLTSSYYNEVDSYAVDNIRGFNINVGGKYKIHANLNFDLDTTSASTNGICQIYTSTGQAINQIWQSHPIPSSESGNVGVSFFGVLDFASAEKVYMRISNSVTTDNFIMQECRLWVEYISE